MDDNYRYDFSREPERSLNPPDLPPEPTKGEEADARAAAAECFDNLGMLPSTVPGCAPTLSVADWIAEWTDMREYAVAIVVATRQERGTTRPLEELVKATREDFVETNWELFL